MPLPPLYIIDFEGSTQTGVIESGVVGWHGPESIDCFTSLYQPKGAIMAQETAVHGLTRAHCADKPQFIDDFHRYQHYRKQGLLVAHNANYEQQLLTHYWPHPGWVDKHYEPGLVHTWGPWIDTLKLFRYFYPKLQAYDLISLIQTFQLNGALKALSEEHCPQDRRQPHAALFDALATMLLLHYLLQEQPELTAHPLQLLYISQNKKSQAPIDLNHTLNFF